jgi:hypothetical protein
MLDFDVPTIKLVAGDYDVLHFITTQTLAALAEAIRTPRQQLSGDLIDFRDQYPTPTTLSCHQILVCAYHGYVPIPASYKSFCQHADRINRKRTSPAAMELRRDESTREREASQEFCLGDRRATKKLYKALDTLAEQHGFPNLEAIWRPSKHIESSPGLATPEEVKAFAPGPLFLWNAMQRSRELGLTDAVFGVHGEWVLYAHHDGNFLFAYPIRPVSMRYGGFHEQQQAGEPPQQVIRALLDLVRCHFPDIPQEQVEIMADTFHEPLLLTSSVEVAVEA